jgi:hypothetical protein
VTATFNDFAGLMNKQIAAELGVSEITVNVHRGNVMRKMGGSRWPTWSEWPMFSRFVTPRHNLSKPVYNFTWSAMVQLW